MLGATPGSEPSSRLVGRPGGAVPIGVMRPVCEQTCVGDPTKRLEFNGLPRRSAANTGADPHIKCHEVGGLRSLTPIHVLRSVTLPRPGAISVARRGHRCAEFRPTPFPYAHRGRKEVSGGECHDHSAQGWCQSSGSVPKGGRCWSSGRCRKRTLNQRVVGSNPTAPTIPFKGLRDGRRISRLRIPRYSPEMALEARRIPQLAAALSRRRASAPNREADNVG